MIPRNPPLPTELLNSYTRISNLSSHDQESEESEDYKTRCFLKLACRHDLQLFSEHFYIIITTQLSDQKKQEEVNLIKNNNFSYRGQYVDVNNPNKRPWVNQNENSSQYTPVIPLIRRNLLEFLNMIILLDNFNFKSPLIQTVFKALIEAAQNDNNSQEFQIVSLMLTRQEMQEQYLNSIIETFRNNYGTFPNFGICIFQRLMSNTISILQGKMKGPHISQNVINALSQASFYPMSTRKLYYENNEDHKNYLFICKHSLCLIRKFISQKKHNLQLFQQTCMDELNNITNTHPQIVNATFGIMAQLCLIHNQFIAIFQKQENFTKIITSSQLYILKCQNVNKFWSVYLQRRQNMLTASLVTFNSPAMLNLFSQYLQVESKTFEHIQKKLEIVDNLVALGNIMIKFSDIKKFRERKIQLSQNNPEKNKIKCFMIDSFEALYSPLFKVQEDSSFYLIVEQLQKLAQQYSNHIKFPFLQTCLPILNLLPALKILLIKYSAILLPNRCFQSLISFLFLLLKQTHSSSVQSLIMLICKQFSSQLMSTNTEDRDRIVFLNSRIEKVVDLILNRIKEWQKIGDIGREVRCLGAVMKIGFVPYHSRNNQWLVQLLEVVGERSYYDEELAKLVQYLIKHMEPNTHVQPIFHYLQKIVLGQKRVSYLELLYDFAETNYQNSIVTQGMKLCNDRIVQLCFNNLFKNQGILRNASYNVMIQSIQKNFNTSLSVIQCLQWVLRQLRFKFKMFIKMIEIVGKQGQVFEKLRAQIHIEPDIIMHLIGIMMNMVIQVHQGLNQNNQCNKAEKTLICEQICYQMLNYCYKYSNILSMKDQKTIEKLQCQIKKLRRLANDFVNNRRFNKLLITCSLIVGSVLEKKQPIQIRYLDQKQFKELRVPIKFVQDEILGCAVDCLFHQIPDGSLSGGAWERAGCVIDHGGIAVFLELDEGVYECIGLLTKPRQGSKQRVCF